MDPENFHSLHNGSPRLQTILEMIAIGRRRSSMLAMSAYCDLFDAGYWLSRAYADAEPALQENFVRLSELVEHTGIYPGVSRITRHFQQDAIDLNRVLAGLGYEGRSRDDAAPVEIDILHALRLALIMHLWLKAMKVPDFSPRNDVTTSNLQTMVLALDVEHALPLLREAFPCHKTRVHTERYIEKADNIQETQTGYDQLHEEVFGPVAQTYQHLLHIGSAITLHHGAHG